MVARPLNSSSADDVAKLYAFLDRTGGRGAVDVRRDLIVVTEAEAKISGLYVSRPINWIHEFRIPKSLCSYAIATALGNFAHGYVRSVGDRIGRRESAIIVVDPTNEALMRFIEERRPTKQSDGDIFTFEV